MTQLEQREQTRVAVVEVAARLLREQGPSAVTTRGVAADAGVQAPTIYRLFGDKDGLLDAVAEHTLSTYVSAKQRMEREHQPGADPVADLAAAWRVHLDFALANPAVFALLADPDRAGSPAVLAGLEVLRARVHRVAAAGRLRVSERRAVELIRAAGTGVALALIATPAPQRDLDLADAMHDAVMRSVLTAVPDPAWTGTQSAAVALRAATAGLQVLTVAERAVLTEWLDRITATP